MKKTNKKSKSLVVQNIQKVDEFKAFLKILELEKIESWENTATALGVHRKTIEIWRRLPEAQKAKAKGIENALKQMERAGVDDWKMWREKLKILGIKDEPSTVIGEQNINLFQLIKEQKNKYGI